MCKDADADAALLQVIELLLMHGNDPQAVVASVFSG